ncbi:MAG: PIN domain-containing protein [Rickettsiaceae bacterium]|nr:PIN domain-containing protein [Rickettsiaceae bacterium]
MKALLDTNIIIDYLNGEQKALQEISNYSKIYISVITYMEVLVGVGDSNKIESIKDYLLSLNIVHIDQEIADLAIEARKSYKLKIPDALVLASAQKVSAILVTRDKKDFSTSIPIVRIPYSI